MKTLIVVDMQNDFIDGSLGNLMATEIVEPLANFIKNFNGSILFTRDTHNEDYLKTQEGKNLPVPHCIQNTNGWEIRDELLDCAITNYNIHNAILVNKNSFGDVRNIVNHISTRPGDEIYICGTRTDICVVSIALNLKARYPEIQMYCLEDLCAGSTTKLHNAALAIMKSCQIEVITQEEYMSW